MGLRRFIDKIKPPFEKGGKLHIFYAGFEAIETFFFEPDKVTSGKVHVKDANDMKRSLIIVIIAMVPALLFGIWNTGFHHFQALGQEAGFWQMVWFGFLKILPIIIVSYVVGLGIEIAFAQWRKEEVAEGYFVSGMLIPLIMPADVPLWMVAVATVFAVVIGKEVFGGTGMNILNPALVARAFLFFASFYFNLGQSLIQYPSSLQYLNLLFFLGFLPSFFKLITFGRCSFWLNVCQGISISPLSSHESLICNMNV